MDHRYRNSHDGKENEKSAEHDLLHMLLNVNDEDDVESIRSFMREAEVLEVISSNKTAQESYEEFRNTYKRRAEQLEHKLRHKKKLFKMNRRISAFTNRKWMVAFICLAFIIIFTNFEYIVKGSIFIFEPIHNWTEDIFSKRIDKTNYSLNEKDNDIDLEECNTFEEIEEIYNITLMKPQYIPKKYQLAGINIFDLDLAVCFMADYVNNGEGEIRFSIFVPFSNNETTYISMDKSDSDVRILTIEGINYYIIRNIDCYTAAWDHNNIEYEVVGFTSEKDLEKFIKKLKI